MVCLVVMFFGMGCFLYLVDVIVLGLKGMGVGIEILFESLKDGFI